MLRLTMPRWQAQFDRVPERVLQKKRPKPEPRTPVLGRKSALDAILGRLCDGAHSLTIIRHARPAAVVRPDGVGRGDLLDREPAENLARQRR